MSSTQCSAMVASAIGHYQGWAITSSRCSIQTLRGIGQLPLTSRAKALSPTTNGRTPIRFRVVSSEHGEGKITGIGNSIAAFPVNRTSIDDQVPRGDLREPPIQVVQRGQVSRGGSSQLGCKGYPSNSMLWLGVQ